MPVLFNVTMSSRDAERASRGSNICVAEVESHKRSLVSSTSTVARRLLLGHVAVLPRALLHFTIYAALVQGVFL